MNPKYCDQCAHFLPSSVFEGLHRFIYGKCGLFVRAAEKTYLSSSIPVEYWYASICRSSNTLCGPTATLFSPKDASIDIPVAVVIQPKVTFWQVICSFFALFLGK